MNRPITRPGDYFGTCTTTGKRMYTSRKTARKDRQAGGHRHGSPYLCNTCSFWHLGRMHVAETRDEYRQSQAGHVHINSATKELGISLETLLLTLDHLGITPENSHIPATVLHQLKQLTYR